MAVPTAIYNALFKRTSTFVLTIAAGTFFFERAFDSISESIWEKNNQGKLWHHIKHKYE